VGVFVEIVTSGRDSDRSASVKDVAPCVLVSVVMTPDELRTRTRKFAVDVLRFAKTSIAADSINNEIGAQLTKAAGAGAAGYRAACRARSRADFIYKLGNTIEEIDESAFWLEILMEAQIVRRESAAALWKEADELTRILVRSQETARRNR
jgi:four helix bundle protein